MAKRILTIRLDRTDAHLSHAAVLIEKLAEEGLKQRAYIHELGIRMDIRAISQHNDLEDRVAAIDKRLTILEHEVHS